MAGESSAQRVKQDQSIKARKNELFVAEEVETGPRKRIRDYLKDTPAAPLSRNVKLMLWGSAAPVALLFVAALLIPGRSRATAPEESVIQLHVKKPAAVIAKHVDDKPVVPRVDEPKREGASANSGASSEKPTEKEKPKNKNKKKKKKDSKPKDDAALAKTDETAKDKNKDKDKDKDKDDGPKKTDSKGKSAMSSDDKGKTATPEKPKQKAASIFKKKKAPVFTYPKRDGEKKAEPTPGDDPP